MSTGVCAGKVEGEGLEDEDAIWGEGDGGADFSCEVGFFEDLSACQSRLGDLDEDIV